MFNKKPKWKLKPNYDGGYILYERWDGFLCSTYMHERSFGSLEEAEEAVANLSREVKYFN